MVFGIMLSGRRAAPRELGSRKLGGCAHAHTRVWRGGAGLAWLAGTEWPSKEEEGWSGGSAIDSGLELYLAGVNMGSME